ncbi:hypothetical protein [Petropleomorpha daqingensis]|uniref:Ig-like domain-containing protein n=1 Tax=Petropleomorpha daqingensis TaxID=2026353 RepID=A0A853CFS5_9ACTN|nr:hypothetical protein [Petropleomorpha daqingensis]NYJ06764.1 hypothetical protein [Petropleomorpha daqingensis]
MNRIRRSAVLLSTAAAVLLGGMLPADAQLADSASVPMAISSVDVLAPTNVSTGGTKCTTAWNGWTWVTTLNAKVTWNASPSRGVSGYVVTAVFSDGTRYPVAQVGSTTTSLTGDYDASYASQNIRVTVTTLTSYGWTEESGLSGVIKC